MRGERVSCSWKIGVLTAHCSPHQREPNKDLTKSPNLDTGVHTSQANHKDTDWTVLLLYRKNALGFLLVVCHHRKAAQVFLLKEESADRATLSSAVIHLPPDGFGGGIYQPLALGDPSSIPPLLHSCFAACSGLSLAMSTDLHPVNAFHWLCVGGWGGVNPTVPLHSRGIDNSVKYERGHMIPWLWPLIGRIHEARCWRNAVPQGQNGNPQPASGAKLFQRQSAEWRWSQQKSTGWLVHVALLFGLSAAVVWDSHCSFPLFTTTACVDVTHPLCHSSFFYLTRFLALAEKRFQLQILCIVQVHEILI